MLQKEQKLSCIVSLMKSVHCIDFNILNSSFALYKPQSLTQLEAREPPQGQPSLMIYNRYYKQKDIQGPKSTAKPVDIL